MREMRWASQDVKVVQFYARLAAVCLHEVLASGLMTLASATVVLLQFYGTNDPFIRSTYFPKGPNVACSHKCQSQKSQSLGGQLFCLPSADESKTSANAKNASH